MIFIKKNVYAVISLFGIILLTSVILYTFLSDKKSTQNKIVTEGVKIGVKDFVLPVISTSSLKQKGEVSYVNISVLNFEKDSPAYYPQITNIPNKEIESNVNTSIKEESLKQIVCGVYNNPNDLENGFRSNVKNVLYTKAVNTDEKENAKYVEMEFKKGGFEAASPQKIITFLSENNYTSSSSVDIVYVHNNIITIKIRGENYCGGAYPDTFVYVFNYDLTTGEKIDVKDIFSNFEKDGKKIEDVYIRKYIEIQKNNKECPAESALMEGFLTQGEGDQNVLGFNDKGLELVSYGFNHATQACDMDVVIPWKEFSGIFIHEDLKKKL